MEWTKINSEFIKGHEDYDCVDFEKDDKFDRQLWAAITENDGKDINCFNTIAKYAFRRFMNDGEFFENYDLGQAALLAESCAHYAVIQSVGDTRAYFAKTFNDDELKIINNRAEGFINGILWT